MLALIYRGDTCHWTTGHSFARALNHLGVLFAPINNNDIWQGYVDLSQFSAVMCIDDGFSLAPRVLPNMPKRSVYFCIDLHASPLGYLPYLHQFGHIFCAQDTYGKKILEEHGFTNVSHLPLAWDSLDITYQPQPRDIPISFVASRTTERRWYLASVAENRYKGYAGTVFHKELGFILSKSRVAINDFGGVGEFVNEKDINLRVFETLGCGSLLLQREFPFPDAEQLGLVATEGWFRDVNPQTQEHYWNRRGLRGDENYVSWKSASQLFHTIEYYLDPVNEEERYAIAERGRVWAQNHTFISRAKTLLDALEIKY